MQGKGTMTWAHFQKIADTLKSQRPTGQIGGEAGLAWDAMVDAFADMCAGANPGFKRERFMTACGAEDRCEHGLFYSGAGACPKCGRGAE